MRVNIGKNVYHSIGCFTFCVSALYLIYLFIHCDQNIMYFPGNAGVGGITGLAGTKGVFGDRGLPGLLGHKGEPGSFGFPG